MEANNFSIPIFLSGMGWAQQDLSQISLSPKKSVIKKQAL